MSSEGPYKNTFLYTVNHTDKASVEALSVDTCELWYHNFKENKMYCIGNYHRDAEEKSISQTDKKQNPLLFEALENKKSILIENLQEYRGLKEDKKQIFVEKNYLSLAFYPILMSEKQRGVLVSYHKKKYRWENEDIIFLRSIHDELALTYQAYRREQAKEKIEKQSIKIKGIYDDLHASINYAQKIQQAMLPSANEVKSYLPEHFIFYKPRDIVSGDFYWTFKAEAKPIYEETKTSEGKHKVLKGFSSEKSF